MSILCLNSFFARRAVCFVPFFHALNLRRKNKPVYYRNAGKIFRPGAKKSRTDRFTVQKGIAAAGNTVNSLTPPQKMW